MFDPRQRLFSHRIPGERLHEERDYVGRLMDRGVEQERKDLVSKHREPVEYKVRMQRPRIEAAPNAPQLMRVWRNPYQQPVARFARSSSGERARPAKRDRINVAAALREGRRQERPKFPKPTDVHIRPEPRVRPELGDWLRGQGRDGEQ